MIEKNKQNVRFMAVGDLMFCCELGEKLRISGDYDYPFAKVRDFLQQADFLYGNLETMITKRRLAERFARPGLYYADPPVAAALGRVNFKAVNLANNHMYDFGSEAVELTMQLLSDAGVMYHGIGRDISSARQPLEFKIKNLKIGMLSYCNASTAIDKKHEYVVCSIKTEIIEKDVSELAKRNNYVIVTLHEGVINYPSPHHRAWAKAAVDAGAKLVISHHSHVINGIEEYKGAIIAYGLGDFVATYEGKKSRDTFILDCLFEPDGKVNYQAVPVWINDDFQPEIADDLRKEKISLYIKELCRKLYTKESDREYLREISNSFLGANFREIVRGFRAEGASVIFRKIKKINCHHIWLFMNSVFRKLPFLNKGNNR